MGGEVSSDAMAREVYIASVGLTKVDLTGRIFASVFDLFSEGVVNAGDDVVAVLWENAWCVVCGRSWRVTVR